MQLSQQSRGLKLTELQDSASTEESQAVTPQVDPYLADLVRIINCTTTSSIGITLVVSGLTISGSLISGERYFEGIQAMMRGAEGDDSDFASYWDPAVVHYRRAREGLEGNVSLPSFIHLRDAVAFPGGSTNSVGLWRGKLESVDSWSLGQLGKTQDR